VSDDWPISTAFYKLAELAEHDGVETISLFPGCWTRQIGKHWWIAVNGHKQPMKASSPKGASKGDGIMVEPFHCYVEFNGWPAGIFSPYGGALAAGEAANEGTFIAAIDAELAKKP
jgi:hypothetical protein